MQAKKSIIVISQFETGLDIIKDIITTKALTVCRFTADDAEPESGSEIFQFGIAIVFLYCHKISITFDALLQ